MKKEEIKKVVENYLLSKEKARVEQSILVSKGVGVLINTLLEELGNSRLKCLFASTEYGIIPVRHLKEFEVDEKADVVIGDKKLDIFKYIDIVNYNITFMKKNYEAMEDELPSEIVLVDNCMERIYELFNRYIKTKSIRIKEFQFKGSYIAYNRYIHGLFNAEKDTIDMLRYTLLTKDYIFIHDYAKVIGKWLQNEYYYDEANDIIVTNDREIIDIKYLAKKAEMQNWLFDLGSVFGEPVSKEVKELNSLCIKI